MEDLEPSGGNAPAPRNEAFPPRREGGARIGRSLSARDVQTYVLCEFLTEALVWFMVVFSPWAFGTTQEWSIWTMNAAGYALAGLLAVKAGIRWRKAYRPPSWETRTDVAEDSSWPFCKRLLAWATAAILAFCLASALNAQSSYDPENMILMPRDHCVKWLPHSLDSVRSWAFFWNYLALAGAFWAVVDWLPGKTAREQRAERPRVGGREEASGRGGSSRGFPARLRRLLWVLTINGGLLAIEGIVQRLSGSGKLLFLVEPSIHKEALTQFGPYAYRSNAAQYFNLLWPVCLGFWWTLRRGAERGRSRNQLALICAGVMAACPIVATTRAGSVITMAMLALAGPAMLAARFLPGRHPSAGRRRHRAEAPREHGDAEGARGHSEPARGGLRPAAGNVAGLLGLFVIGALALGLGLGWKQLKPRLAEREVDEGFQVREQMYEAARPIAEQYPVFGTGPGTFVSVADFYRKPDEPLWWEQLHNDWLETRITFGWVGSALIALAMAAVALRWFDRGGIHASGRFMVLCWLAMAGTGVFAAWDFPFQIYSVLFLFLIICAMMANLSGRAK